MRTMRTVGLILVAVVGVGGLWTLRARESAARSREVFSGRAETEAAPAPAPAVRSRPLPPTVKVLDAPPAIPNATAARPQSLLDVPFTPELVRGLQEMTRDERLWLDYKLGFLSKLESCVQGRIQSHASIQLWAHFNVDAAKQEATGTDVELTDSGLTTDEEAVFTECAESAHAGTMLRLPHPPDEGEYHVNTVIAFPLDDDAAYSFLKTGTWPTRS